MEILYNELYKIFVQELININIGHLPDKKALFTMNELINAIDYIEHGLSLIHISEPTRPY